MGLNDFTDNVVEEKDLDVSDTSEINEENKHTDVKLDEDGLEHREIAQLDGSVLGEFIKYRLTNNRDVKVIVTSKSSSTGLGKTTLAIQINRWIYDKFFNDYWSAEKYGFLDVENYIDTYQKSQEQTPLLIDEIEHGADSRRFMSKENVGLSHAWATLRYKNIFSIATLPTTSMLDSRMMELSDIWINVVKRGVALAYYIWINDFTGELYKIPIRHPETANREVMSFGDLDGDPAFEYMSKLKDATVTGKDTRRFDNEEVQKEKKKAAKDKRNQIIYHIYEQTDLSQSDIAKALGNFDEISSQQSVSRIIKKMKD